MKRLMLALSFVLAILFTFGPAHAALVTYNYQGANLIAGSSAITGVITFDPVAGTFNATTHNTQYTATALSSWSFSYGPITSSSSDSVPSSSPARVELSNASFAVNGSGAIVEWLFLVYDGIHGAFSLATANPAQVLISFDGITWINANDAYISGSTPWAYNQTAGTWTMAAVPIPGALLLFGPGLAGIIAIRKRYKK